MRWKKLNLQFAVFLLVFSFFSALCHSQEDARQSMRKELSMMLLELEDLKTLQDKRERNFQDLQSRLIVVEMRLKEALQKLEKSQLSVIELQKLTEDLRKELEILKVMHESVLKSLRKEKGKKKFWRTAAVVAVVAAGVEGLVHGLR